MKNAICKKMNGLFFGFRKMLREEKGEGHILAVVVVAVVVLGLAAVFSTEIKSIVRNLVDKMKTLADSF